MKLYDTMSREVKELTTLEENKVKMYTCGLTVYSQPHIGNWVAYIYWDVLQRTLEHSGYQVERVQNITDVGHLTSDEDAGEDKMLQSALKEGRTAWEVADKYIEIANKESSELGLKIPQHMPRATDYINQQIAFIQALEEKGLTYRASDGIYFNTSKLDNYGKLARLDIEGLRFGARVENTGKKNPTDFALWKFSPKDQKRDMEWESPWGVGFPGWHLECSVLAREILGNQIDIHTGGIDHIPVHHVNEIAQTESLTGIQFSKLWVHANHIKVDGTKMSKSLGNIYTLEDIKNKGYSLNAFKLLVLSKHYRTEGNFTWEILEAAQNRLNNLRRIAELRYQPIDIEQPQIANSKKQILSILNEDLNTPLALSFISATLGRIEEDDYISKDNVTALIEIIDTMNELLGINIGDSSDITDEQKELIAQREVARKNKDWEKSDELREKLKEQGIDVRDTPHGTIWSRLI